MNKIQYIKLLKIRGITELNGMSMAGAVKQTGGKPTNKEMVEVNKQAMIYYIEKFTEQKEINNRQAKTVEGLQMREDWLICLEQAGVDNWEGYSVAVDISNNII